MTHLPYVRLRPEDLRPNAAIWGWTLASPEVVSDLGLSGDRRIAIPLAGPRPAEGRRNRLHAREGLATLFALEPSHADRTLYVDLMNRWDRGFERWLENRVACAFARERYERGLREAVVLVNLFPGRPEARFNLGLLLTRLLAQDPEGVDARRWAALARGEFGRAAEISPELLWGWYHRGVLAYEAGMADAARQDWQRLLDRYFADKPAPRSLTLPLAPLEDAGESAELPGLAYTVLLDFLGLVLPRRSETGVAPQASPQASA